MCLLHFFGAKHTATPPEGSLRNGSNSKVFVFEQFLAPNARRAHGQLINT